MKKEQEITVHPGIKRMNLPYFITNITMDDSGVVDARSVPVDMFVGGYMNYQNGYHATVIIYEDENGMPIQNFFDDIATIIANNYLINFLSPVPYKSIRWVEVYSDDFSQSTIVSEKKAVIWDEKSKRYYYDDVTNQVVWRSEYVDLKQNDVPWYVEYTLGESTKYQKKNYF